MAIDGVRRIMLRWLSLVCALLLLAVPFGAARAQDGATYPNTSRTIRLIVPYTPGTTSDTLARLLGAKLAERWKVAVVIDNRAGASGVIGMKAAAEAAPDGYTFLFTANSLDVLAAINPLLPLLPFDPARSVAPVVLLTTGMDAVVVSPQLPVSSLREFIELAKKQPGKLNYSSSGSGTFSHLVAELLLHETGIHLLHVPYKGASGAITDLISGQVQMSIVALQTAGPFVKSGKLTILAVTGDERSSAFPNVSTLKELGLPSLVVHTWCGVFAPAGTPADIVARLNAELNLLLQQPDVRDVVAKQNLILAGGKPERLSELLKAELAYWSRVVGAAKIKID